MNLTEKAMLVRQRIKTWSGRKIDKQITNDVIDQHHASPDSGRWNKVLVAKDALETVNKTVSEARAHHYQHTLIWEDGGTRILPAAAYFDYMDGQRDLQSGFETAAAEFARNYPQYIADARQNLNSMFNPCDYPPVHDILGRFAFATIVSPLPDKDDFRVTLADAERDRIQAEIEDRNNQILADATAECWQRLHDCVQKMAERLSDSDNRFRDTLVTNLRELVDLLPKLNLANDPRLERMRQDIAGRLCQNDPATLRPASRAFNSAARARQSRDAEQILAEMTGYVD